MRRLFLCTVALSATIWILNTETALALDCDSGTFEGAFDTEVVIPQNLDCEDRQKYWFTDQGSQIIPYLWFLNLEQADSTKKFAHPSNMDRLGYLPQRPTDLNPDGLPIGFTIGNAKNNRPYKKISDRWLGLTCSACHTGQVEYRGDKFLIDGAPTMGDFEKTFVEMTDAMQATLADREKFDRFAKAVIADSRSRDIDGTRLKSRLRRQLQEVTDIRAVWNGRNKGETLYGHGRLDALGAIFNETAATALEVPGNKKMANAPVSYPFVWDTPQHDKVQWNGSIPNEKLGSLARNVGEVLGVFGRLDLRRKLILPVGHGSSVNVDGLATLEGLLAKMQSPQWSDTTLPEIDTGSEQHAEGQAAFKDLCASCHTDEFKRSDENRSIRAVMIPVGSSDNPRDLRTDDTMARNFLDRKAQASALTGEYERYLFVLSGGKRFESDNENEVRQVKILGYSVIGSIVRAFLEDPQSVIKALKAGRPQSDRLAIQKAGERLLSKWKGSNTKEKLKSIRGFFDTYGDVPPDMEAAVTRPTACFPKGLAACYKARPLNGIWATAPYLHNGSVRTMRELLFSADEREETFKVGSREFDPDDIGFVNEGAFEFDTTLPGNSNAGHDGPVYGTDELARNPDKLEALLEYLKGL
jgi:processive rubber oxygenase RoxA-like protein